MLTGLVKAKEGNLAYPMLALPVKTNVYISILMARENYAVYQRNKPGDAENDAAIRTVVTVVGSYMPYIEVSSEPLVLIVPTNALLVASV